MSLRSVWGPRGRIRTIERGLALLIILLIAPLPAGAQTDHQNGAGVFSINSPSVRVGFIDSVTLGQTVSVPITFVSSGAPSPLSGFNLVLVYDSSVMTLTSVTAGSVISDCKWQYFAYDVGAAAPLGCGDQGCREKKIHIIGQANVGSGTPATCNIEAGGILATLEFRVVLDSSHLCQFLPISWAWYYCNDNVFTKPHTDSLVLSDSVYVDWGGYLDNITQDLALPNQSGAPSCCLIGNRARSVSFVHGGVDVACPPQPERADLNLNGYAYEISDELLYQNYFLKGRSVFTVFPKSQIVSSDVNADGIPLTVADLMYLSEVILGMVMPIPKVVPTSADTAIIMQDTIARSVSLVYADSLSAVHLVFNGPIQPNEAMLGIDTIKYEIDSGITRVLITPPLPFYPYPMPTFGSGLLFSYTGAGRLTSADAALDGTVVIPSKIQGSSALNCCHHRGNVDGINDPSGSVDVSDLTLLLDYIFSSATLTCWAEADVDGDGAIDVSDVTALVDFLFFAGKIPSCQ